MARTSLAVSSSDMNAFEFVLGVIQCFTQRNGIVKVFFIRSGTNTAEHREMLIKMSDGLLVGHRDKDSRQWSKVNGEWVWKVFIIGHSA